MEIPLIPPVRRCPGIRNKLKPIAVIKQPTTIRHSLRNNLNTFLLIYIPPAFPIKHPLVMI
jgi:hypothetical protein